MNRVMEGLIELAITAKAVAECKSILFSTRREGMLPPLCIKHHVSATQRCQAGRPSHSQRCFSSKCSSRPEK